MSFAMVTVLLVGCFVDEEPDRTEIATELGELARGGDKVDVCHIPPGNPANAHTINVSENAVAAHLAHGDALGDCVCVSDCTELGDRVEAICLELLEGFPTGGIDPKEFCGLAAEVVNSSCGGSFCEQPPGPESCFDACADIANSTLEACFELVPDPVICEIGADVTFSECLALFECPPPPPPCDVQCIDDANAMLFACFENPPEELICEGAEANPVEQTCFAEGQGYLNGCLFGEEGCFGPPVDCFSGCQAGFGEDVLACVSEPVCQNPADCQVKAEENAAECFGGCCMRECVASECEPRCEGDRECVAQCEAEICEPACFPAPTCDQLCADEANAFIEECLAEPSEPICEDFPDALCLSKGYSIFADCLEGQCEIDGCGPRCIGDCVASCNEHESCSDPSVNPCLESCGPPADPCVEECEASFDKCLSQPEPGPETCELEFGQCLDLCYEPPN